MLRNAQRHRASGRAIEESGFGQRMRHIAALAASALVLGMFAAVSPLAAPSASAAPGEAFDDARPTVFVAQSQTGSPTGLYRSETAGDGTYAFTPEGGPIASGNYNAISYNAANQFVYGAVITAIGGIPRNALVRIGQGGVVTRVGSATYPVAQWAGAFNPANGLLYSTNGGVSTSAVLYRANPTTGVITAGATITGANWTLADFEVHDGYLWAFNYNAAQPAGTIARIDPNTGILTNFPGVIPGAVGGAWGAAWKFGNGNLGFSNNGTGNIAQLRITNGSSTTPTFEVISMTAGPPSSGNDGTAIPGDPVDLAMDKSAPPRFTPGGEVAYTLTVTNNGPGESSGWSFSDVVPADLTGVSVTSDDATCTADINTVSCAGGRLLPGDSVEIIITGTSSATAVDCFNNTATVLGNELDPDETNNSDSAEVCPRILEITKQSDATENTRVGDTVTYIVTATNVGAADYTDADPAYVFDDLSAVLDDATYNAHASATLPGTVSYTAPTLSWSGALAAGATVELEYTVTMVAGGDGDVRNVAWEPNVPTDSTPPACAPPVDGRDPVTGESCAEVEFLLPKLTITKTADRTDLPAVGESVEYTVVVTNVGPGVFTAAAPATFTDDLTEVLDDATFVFGMLSSGVVTYVTPKLSWSGALGVGESVTVTYSVVYTGAGDQLLDNRACIPASETAAGQPSCDTVQIPGSDLTQWKQATPSSDPVVAGSTITYTLFFNNTGEAPATANAVDNLVHVLDDAEIAIEPTSPDGLTVARDGDEITITGLVPAGEQYTVTYTVAVLPDADRNDSVATNFLLPPGGTPPPDGECTPVDPAAPNCTTTPITGVIYAKSVVASENPVQAGTELAYTITVTNTGATVVDVNRDDNLAGVLDDAAITTPVASDTASVTATGPAADIIAIRGTLAAGATATITYTVTVNAPTDRGDSIAANYIVTPGEAPDPGCDPADGLCTLTPIQSYSVSKSVDKSVVIPGDVLAYTVTVINTGAVAFDAGSPASFTDDLAAVLDDAVYNDDVSAGGVVTGDQLSWSGPLAVGETVLVTYSVTVNSPLRGNGLLTNAVVPTAPTGECEPADTCITETPVLALTVEKDVDVSSAMPGDVVSYSVTVSNIGQADYTAATPAALLDELGGVLDDATYNNDASSGATLTGTVLSWSGPLAAGQSQTITYSVTVNDPISGDQALRNTVSTPSPGGSCASGNSCETETPVASFTVNKEADVATVLPGGIVNYTVAVTNTSDVDYTIANPASFSDDLTGVFDDAVYNGDVSTGGAVTGNTLTWSGALAAGDTVTVTYSVTVDASVSGDFTLVNAVVPTAPGGECDVNCTTETPVSALRVEKTSTSTEVVPGDVVEYQIVITNTGQVDYTSANPASFTDDLAAVLDDANYNDDAASGSGAGIEYVDGVLEWTGPLAIGASVTVTYSVTVNDPASGDSRLENTVVTPPGTGGNCDEGSTDPDCTVQIPAAGFSLSKSTDVTSALPGDVVTYSVIVTNTGSVDYTNAAPASFSDDLARVLDDATYNDDVSTGGVITGDQLAWSGALAVGESITVTYSVTVDDPISGDFQLRNVVTPTAPGGECIVDECVTTTPIAAYLVSKTADAATVVPGGVVTYTVTVENIGGVAYDTDYPATFTDDLSSVIDDATYNGDVTAGGTVVDAELSWTGPVGIDETVTVTYSVTVNDPATGDGTLTNAVIPDGPGGKCDPDAECVASTPVLSYSVDKAADVASVMPGDQVTYTVTVTNTGQADYTDAAPASFTDDLTAVLDDAVYNDDASSGAAVEGAVLSWSGALVVGETVTVTYSVTVNDPISGDQMLDNAVVPTSPGGSCVATDGCVTQTPVASYTVNKQVDAATSLPGGVVTYSITVTNTGAVDYTDSNPASFSDDLSGVLDDAVYNGDVSEGGAVSGNTLTWSGAVAAGESVMVTYSVTIDDPILGDFDLVNAVVPTAPGGGCDTVCTTQTPLASYLLAKTTASTEVVPGEVVEYAIVITNTGQVDYTDAMPASFTDDLAAVLDDATYNGDAVSDSGTGVEYVDGVLSWSGPLAIGTSVTVTYSVTVNEPATGDGSLENVVVTPPGSGGNCDVESTDPACVANVPAASFTISKSADAATALPGDTVTYTVTVTNTGEVAYTEEEPASFTDDLSRVLDDATYNDDVSDGGDVDGDVLSWSGPLAVGESIEVTYSVTVHVPVEGDFTLRNVVMPSAPGGECVEEECVTETPIASYMVAKDADVEDVVLGGVVTYSVTVTNTGQVAYTEDAPASFIDDLSEVLDDAAYNGDVSAGGAVAGSELTWSGPLAVGESVVVTYSVTVAQLATGDGMLRNSVIPDGPAGTCDTAADCAVETPIAAFQVDKQVSSETVAVGGTVTYTIRVTNIGQVDYTDARPAAFSDDLSSALSLGTYNNDATHGAEYDAPILSWEGALASGESVSVTYSVTATHVGEITNVVVTAPESGANCAPDSGDPDCRTVIDVIPGLAITGGAAWGIGGTAGLVLVALGIWFYSRRRQLETVG
ncbi:DUF6923 family protein [Microbacterium sp. A84]|uniref:DUF7927 domain-containing protein n=1 Tax=Microbacterium sp. A84 TaxID=3450715 RepID=UPI003F41DD71